MNRPLLTWCTLAALLTGCAGGQALKRRTGPVYEAETESWIRALHRLGGNGMWLVTRGYHSGDDLVAVTTNSPLSHASVLDLDRAQVVEAIGRGVVVTELRTFLRETHRVMLVRPNSWAPGRGRAFVARARGQVGKKYDYLGAIGLPQIKRWYCTELAAWSAGIRVNRQGPKHVLHPRVMHRYGTVLFDSGQRDSVPDGDGSAR